MKKTNKTGLTVSGRQSQILTRKILIVSILFCVTIGAIIAINLSSKNIHAAATGDYRSAASGEWSIPANWELYNGSSWVQAISAPASNNGTITIQSGHAITVSGNVTADQLVIDTNGTLTINAGTFTLANGAGNDLIINGTLNVASTMSVSGNAFIQLHNIANCNTGGSMTFNGGSKIAVNNNGIFNKNGGTVTTSNGIWTINSGGTFNLNDQTAIPVANWNTGSTCVVKGVSSIVPANLNQQFANFKWDCFTQASPINLSGALQNINGDFTLLSTGASYIQLDLQGNNTTLNVGGSIYIQGGVFYGCTNGGTTVNVATDFVQTGGLFSFNLSGGTAYGNLSMVMNVTGNVIISGGTMDMTQCSANNSAKGNGVLNVEGNINLSGSGLMTETSLLSRGKVNISGTVVQYFTSSSLSNVTRFVDFTVNSGSILRMDDQVITGDGSFTLLNGGGIMIGHDQGISVSGPTGNIQVTGTRTFNTGSDYTYNGLAAQVTGNGLPGQVRNLTFSNSNNITLTNSTSVSSNLNFNAGICIASNDTLTLGISAATRGTLNRVSGHVVGYFRRWFASSNTNNTLFPVGTLAYYNPAFFSYTNSPSAGSIVCRFVPSNPGTLGLPLTDAGTLCYTMGYAYWSFGAMNGLSGGQCTVKLTGDGFPGVTDYSTLHLLRRAGSGSPWTSNGLHAAGTGSNLIPEANRTKMTLLGDYGISSDAVNPLPTELISFVAKANTEYVDLAWATSSEVNNDFFTVERSADGITFTKLLTKKGSGNSTTVNNYSAADLNPLPGYSYYQLRQTDFNGQSSLSDMVIVYFDKNDLKDNSLKIISVSNFRNTFTLQYRSRPNADFKLSILNTAGKLVYETSLRSSEHLNSFTYSDEKNLPAGIYFIQLIGDGQKSIQKIIKD